MPRDVAAGVAPIRIPTGTDIAAVAKIGRIETQTGDHRESVAGPRKNRDPAAATAFAVTHEIARRQRRRKQSRAMQRIGDRARAIVAAIVKRTVSAAPDVRFAANGVRGPD